MTDIFTLMHWNLLQIWVKMCSWGWKLQQNFQPPSPHIHCRYRWLCVKEEESRSNSHSLHSVILTLLSREMLTRFDRAEGWNQHLQCSPSTLRQCRPPSLKPWSSPTRSWSWWWEHFSSISAAWSGLFATQSWAATRKRVGPRKKSCNAWATSVISRSSHTGAPVCSRTVPVDSHTPLMSTFGTTQTVCCQTAPRFAVKTVESSTILEVTWTEQLVTSCIFYQC